ncbi:MAG: hypothetical protein SFX73_38760 [Kofleriaceae bacterium]|nr:hypothetical protein [Kofleriaceae bacterium]
MKPFIPMILVSAVLPIAIATADRPAPRQPPQAALDACAKAKQGDTCSFTVGDRTLKGTCSTPPDGSALACRPEHPPGLPPQAIDACASAKEGDACSVQFGDRTIEGTCAKHPDGDGPLACRPAHRPR